MQSLQRHKYARPAWAIATLLVALLLNAQPVCSQVPEDYEFNDSHFHLTNYIQEGIDIRDFLEIMGDKAGRVALFGIPLQQTWSHSN